MPSTTRHFNGHKIRDAVLTNEENVMTTTTLIYIATSVGQNHDHRFLKVESTEDTQQPYRINVNMNVSSTSLLFTVKEQVATVQSLLV